jgi:hypothetical protein
MLKRRLKQAGLPAHYSPHSFRATGITNFLENDRTLEAAQRIAGHADSRTTKLYDRRGQKVLLEDMERIRSYNKSWLSVHSFASIPLKRQEICCTKSKQISDVNSWKGTGCPPMRNYWRSDLSD